ncbi:MAG: hypothetical protein IT480_07100 [Gammaproteobacteria bacterium]|nr:hypothetical protein [Gammaproteobacteria bacterium]
MTDLYPSKLSVTSLIGQIVLYGALAAVLAVFANWPSYRQLAPDQALIKLSIVHEPQHVQPCRQRTPEELARLPPNMRAPMICTRERAPLVAEIDLDGQRVLRQVAQPSGLAHDGRATLYHRLVTSAGPHQIVVRLRDQAGTEAFNYQGATRVDLRPAQSLVVDFEPAQGLITFR